MPPTGCLTGNPPPPRIYDGRPSGDHGDLGRVRNDSTAIGYALRGYVMDKDSIYAIPPGTTAQNRMTRVTGYAQTDTAASGTRL